MFVKPIIKSIVYIIKNNPVFKYLKNKHSPFFKFIKKRLTSSEKYGLYLTIGSIITLFFIYLFFEVFQSCIGQEALITTDLRILNLISTLRQPNLNRFMLFVTYLAKSETIIMAVIFSLLILFLLRKWSYFYSLLIFVAGGELFVWIIKNIIERPRPPLYQALVAETSYSFPSGHTFVSIAFYGLIAFFIFDSTKKRYLKIISLVFGIIIVSLIGISRIYLGAHWPSDVLASLVSGLAWLSIIITISHIKKKFSLKISQPFRLQPKNIIKMSVLLVIIFSYFVYFFYQTHPLKTTTPVQAAKNTLKSDEIRVKLFETLPKISESITNTPIGTINLIIVGNNDLLNRALIKSGWNLLDEFSLKSFQKTLTSSFAKEPYLLAPSLPVFWGTIPNKINYLKLDFNNSTNIYHYIHLWETDFVTLDNQPIWVATAYFGEKNETISKIVLRHYSAYKNIDAERESIKSTLEENGFILSFEKIILDDSLYTTISSNNSFTTDNQAYILYLKNQ